VSRFPIPAKIAFIAVLKTVHSRFMKCCVGDLAHFNSGFRYLCCRYMFFEISLAVTRNPKTAIKHQLCVSLPDFQTNPTTGICVLAKENTRPNYHMCACGCGVQNKRTHTMMCGSSSVRCICLFTETLSWFHDVCVVSHAASLATSWKESTRPS
jgi:hypothetical protein